MSAASAESSRAPSGAALVWIALGLMALAGVAAWLLLGTGGPIDGRAQMTAVFGAADLPSGLAISSATKMPSAGSIVVYERAGAAPDAPPPPAPEMSMDGGGPRTDWAKVEIPAASGPPRQASFLFAPAASGRSVLDAMIRHVQGQDRGMLGPGGGTTLVERGRVDFRGWDSEWIHLRTYETGGTFRDAMRISLSTPEQPCVMTATWSRGVPATLAELQALVAPLVDGPR